MADNKELGRLIDFLKLLILTISTIIFGIALGLGKIPIDIIPTKALALIGWGLVAASLIMLILSMFNSYERY